MEITLGCIQINSTSNVDINIDKISNYLNECLLKGCNIVLLPENVACMPFLNANAAYNEDNHPFLEFIKKFCYKNKIYIIIGSLSIKSEIEGKVYNRSYVVSDDGTIISTYNKIHLFNAIVNNVVYNEGNLFLQGNKATIASLPFCNIGLTICYDLRFPNLYRLLALNGAHLIVVPSAFTKTTGEAHWEVLLRTRAIETGCFIIAANQCGKSDDGKETYGHSMIIDPWGKIIAKADNQEGIIVCAIDTDEIIRVRDSIGSLNCNPSYEIGK